MQSTHKLIEKYKHNLIEKELPAAFKESIDAYRRAGYFDAAEQVTRFQNTFKASLKKHLTDLNENNVEQKTLLLIAECRNNLEQFTINYQRSEAWYQTPTVIRSFIGVLLLVGAVVPYLTACSYGVHFFRRPASTPGIDVSNAPITTYVSEVITKFERILKDQAIIAAHPKAIYFKAGHLEWADSVEIERVWKEAKSRLVDEHGLLLADGESVTIENRTFIILNRKILVQGKNLPKDEQGKLSVVSYAEDDNQGLWIIKKINHNVQIENHIGTSLGHSLNACRVRVDEANWIGSVYLGSTLKAYIKEHQEILTEQQRFDLICVILEAIDAFHQGDQLYLHNDLHVGNITIDDSDDNVLKAHLIDFGRSTIYIMDKDENHQPVLMQKTILQDTNVQLQVYMCGEDSKNIADWLKWNRSCDLKITLRFIFKEILTENMLNNSPTLQALNDQLKNDRLVECDAGEFLMLLNPVRAELGLKSNHDLSL